MSNKIRYIGPFESLGRLINSRNGRIAIMVFLVLVVLLTCVFLFAGKPSNTQGTVTPTSYLLQQGLALLL